MSEKRPSSKHKIDRRLGLNLWGRAKSPYNTRQTGPGMHGARRAKPTDYGILARFGIDFDVFRNIALG